MDFKSTCKTNKRKLDLTEKTIGAPHHRQFHQAMAEDHSSSHTLSRFRCSIWNWRFKLGIQKFLIFNLFSKILILFQFLSYLAWSNETKKNQLNQRLKKNSHQRFESKCKLYFLYMLKVLKINKNFLFQIQNIFYGKIF